MSALTPKRIEQLRLRLMQRRDELNAQILNNGLNPANKDLTDVVKDPVRDPGDDALALQTSDMNISETEKAMAELQAVEAALARIEDGTYGDCMDCGGEIPFERLDAYPTAIRCTGCQGRRENLRRDISPSL